MSYSKGTESRHNLSNYHQQPRGPQVIVLLCEGDFIETVDQLRPCHSPLLGVILLSIQGGLDVFITSLHLAVYCTEVLYSVKASYWTSLRHFSQLRLATVSTTVVLDCSMLSTNVYCLASIQPTSSQSLLCCQRSLGVQVPNG